MKNNKIFQIIVIAFILLVIAFTWHMSSKTVKPWDKKKNNVLEKYKVQ